MSECVHRWLEGERLSSHAYRVTCERCGFAAIAKSKDVPNDCVTTTADEVLCYRLAALLKGRGSDIRLPWAVLSAPLSAVFRGEAHANYGPWYQWSAILEDLGPHAQLGFGPAPEGAKWPGWLYWFDRWIGRLDGQGGNNLLLLPDGTVQPVDWSCVFPWAIGFEGARPPTNLEVPVRPEAYAARDVKTRAAIKSLTDEDIWTVVVASQLPMELCPTALLVAYWSGLCVRRELL